MILQFIQITLRNRPAQNHPDKKCKINPAYI